MTGIRGWVHGSTTLKTSPSRKPNGKGYNATAEEEHPKNSKFQGIHIQKNSVQGQHFDLRFKSEFNSGYRKEEKKYLH